VVTHLGKVLPSTLVEALNRKLLGARILQSGGNSSSKKSRSMWAEVYEEFTTPNSLASRAVISAQALAFAIGLACAAMVPEALASQIPYSLAILLGHALPRRAIMSALACRLSIHVLMFIVLLGALCLGQLREAATVSILVSGSEYLLSWVNAAVEEAMSKNLVGTSTHATKLLDGDEQSYVPMVDLIPGDNVLLKTGEVIPVDGRVSRASSLKVDEACVTGEALPCEKEVGSTVSSGSVVVSGSAVIECTARVEDSFQGRMGKAVADARASESKTEEIVNKIAGWYTPIVVMGSLCVAIFTLDVQRGLATLISACPCALVAAAPVAQSCTLVRLLRDFQVLVKNTKALENLGKLGSLAVDKTGTLTEGNFTLVDHRVLPDAGKLSKDQLLRLLAAVESQDPHPLANSLVKAHVGCVADHLGSTGSSKLPTVQKFTRVESAGVWGIVESKVVGAGSATFLDAMSIDIPKAAKEVLADWEKAGGCFTTVYMTLEDDVVLMLRLEDQVRLDAPKAVAILQEELGVLPSLLTGDTAKPAEAVARKVGIVDVRSALKPLDKAAWLKAQKECSETSEDHIEVAALEEGLRAPLVAKPKRAAKPWLWRRQGAKRPVVGMLGDGLNDGPALAAADVGIAVSAGLQLTVDAADVVVNQGATMLLRLAGTVSVAKRCHRLVLQNLTIAAFIKISAIGLGASGHLSLGSGVLSDTGSFLIVLMNSLRPLRWDLTSVTEEPAAT